MKNILLISWHFAPRNTIAAIRFTKVVKYLARTGKYHFWVICSELGERELRDELLQRDIDEVSEYVTILPVSVKKSAAIEKLKNLIGNKGTCMRKESRSANQTAFYTVKNELVLCQKKGMIGMIKRFLGRMLIVINDVYIFISEDMAFAREGSKLSKQLPMNDMDAMISTWGPTGNLLLGLKYKKMKKQIKWIIDYRDIFDASSLILRGYLNYVACKAERKANYITGASKTCIGSGRNMRKVHVITNGFDKEDIPNYSQRSQNEKLQIAYTGTVVPGKSNMTLLFKIIYELENEGLLNKENISIIYAGKQCYILQDQAKAYGMEKVLIDKGELSRKKALELQQQADILCVLTWNTDEVQDVITGKFIEYFMMKKPIFSIVTGNKPNSIVKRITKEAELGYSLEEASGLKEYKEAKQWILSQYLEFMQNGCLKNNINEKVLIKYSSARLAEKFEKLINA